MVLLRAVADRNIAEKQDSIVVISAKPRNRLRQLLGGPRSRAFTFRFWSWSCGSFSINYGRYAPLPLCVAVLLPFFATTPRCAPSCDEGDGCYQNNE
jgi:hypothetical protein